MKYDFEAYIPPRLTEASLRAERRRRQLRRQTALLALSAALLQTALLLLGVLLWPDHPLLGAACLIYVTVSVTGGSMLALAISGRKEFSS